MPVLPARPSDLPLLPCPECKVQARSRRDLRASDTLTRIGNHRRTCTTCNNFAQAVLRKVRARLLESHPEEAARFRLEAERELYIELIERWTRQSDAGEAS